MDNIVIVGGGQAAAECAIELRSRGFGGPITIVGDEPFLPYQRPPLSKDYLAGRASEDKLWLRPENFWREHQVALELGTPVKAIERDRRKIALAGGRELAYGKLVLATGARSKIPPLPGIELDRVFLLRRIDEAQRIRAAVEPARRIAIVGGGYIGLEAAAVFRGQGHAVTVIETEERVMKRVTSVPVSNFYELLHRARGVDILLGVQVVAIEGDGRAAGLRLARGERIAADVVLIATGATPNDELATETGLACEDGIVVDEFARTADENIYAIGDCTRFPSRRYGRRVRLECVQHAFDHGKAAAAAILGTAAPYDPVPWFWSDQYNVKFQSAGLADGHDELKVVGDVASGHFSVEYRKGGKLIAVDAINDARAYVAGRKRIAQETAAALPA